MPDEYKKIVQAGIKATLQEIDKAGIERGTVKISFPDDPKRKWKPKAQFCKVYMHDLKELLQRENFDSYCLGAIMTLFPYVEYETNLIANRGKYLSKKDIQRLLNYSENKTDQVLNILISKRVMAKTKVGRDLKFFMNPEIIFSGVYLNPETSSIFRILE